MPARTSTHPDWGKDVVSLNEAACRLGKHPATYLKLMEEGLVPGIKGEKANGGKSVVITRQSFELFLKLGRMPRYSDFEESEAA